jgi:hypothetical protein
MAPSGHRAKRKAPSAFAKCPTSLVAGAGYHASINTCVRGGSFGEQDPKGQKPALSRVNAVVARHELNAPPFQQCAKGLPARVHIPHEQLPDLEYSTTDFPLAGQIDRLALLTLHVGDASAESFSFRFQVRQYLSNRRRVITVGDEHDQFAYPCLGPNQARTAPMPLSRLFTSPITEELGDTLANVGKHFRPRELSSDSIDDRLAT